MTKCSSTRFYYTILKQNLEGDILCQFIFQQHGYLCETKKILQKCQHDGFFACIVARYRQKQPQFSWTYRETWSLLNYTGLQSSFVSSRLFSATFLTAFMKSSSWTYSRSSRMAKRPASVQTFLSKKPEYQLGPLLQRFLTTRVNRFAEKLRSACCMEKRNIN